MNSPTLPGAARQLRLKDFDFGYASADAEASDRPDLLLRGYFDHSGIIQEALHGKKFLFLGYKGSGKSALGEHLVLGAKNKPELFIRMVNIADISFRSFSQIFQKDAEPEARYPTSWSWLFLLQFLASFARDKGSNVQAIDDLWLAIEVLEEAGLLPDPELAKNVRDTLEMNFKVKLAGIVELGRKQSTRQGSDLPFFVERLKLVIQKFESPNKHIIIVDGFDDLLRRRSLQYDALGALIFEANRLNSFFSRSSIPAKLILLCRTDLFERLPGPNNNKIRQDYAITLEWHHGANDARVSPLLRLINHRASLRTNMPVDIVSQFLPPMIQGLEARKQLLLCTRLVPRDMVMLFKKLQEYSGDEPMAPGQVFDALAAYSNGYFVQEIRDELDGQVDGDEIGRAFRLFSSVRKRVVGLAELQARSRQLLYPSTFNIKQILLLLFECSAVGNSRATKPDWRNSVFKFNNPYSTFDEGQLIVFHQALWEGLDLR